MWGGEGAVPGGVLGERELWRGYVTKYATLPEELTVREAEGVPVVDRALL